ncbi:spermidine synthase [Lentzea sp. NPDC051213]|uniref:spermidine synthase n=1 Tax=Lentzea sp. NPDC051213 TaxID=3364126 RepID=UPI003795097C
MRTTGPRFETVQRRRVRSGLAEVERDRTRADAWLVSVDGLPQSYVDLTDPTDLPCCAMRRVADVIDALPPAPLSALHIGGAACSLPRYIQHTRPGSDQLVVDVDGELVDLVTTHLPIPAGIDLQVENGLDTIRNVRGCDLVVVDVFEGNVMPAEFASTEFHADVAAALAGDRTYIVNVFDRPGLRATAALVSAVTEWFGEPLVIAEVGVLRGEGIGNVVIVSTDAELPVEELDRRARAARFPARVSAGWPHR